jgi:hypothetical protein
MWPDQVVVVMNGLTGAAFFEAATGKVLKFSRQQLLVQLFMLSPSWVVLAVVYWEEDPGKEGISIR